jgi:hypothetical protein
MRIVVEASNVIQEAERLKGEMKQEVVKPLRTKSRWGSRKGP